MLQEYLKNSTIHGLKYIADKNNHWIERLFWAMIVTISVYYSVILTLESWDNFNKEAVTFVIDTNYLEWNTSFPAVTICEEKNFTRLLHYCQKMIGITGEDFDDIDCTLMMGEIVFFEGVCTFCKNDDSHLQKLKEDYYHLSQNIRLACKEAFYECKWKGKAFNCCAVITILRTEFGPCFSFNSIQSMDSVSNNFISNTRDGLGNLELKINMDFKLFLHAPDSIPHWTTSESMRTTVKRGELIEHIIKVIDTTNDNEVHELPPEQRQCNLPKEIDKYFLYPFYSHSACAIACRSRHTMKICNCTLHFLPQTSTGCPCTEEGLSCIDDIFTQLKNMKIRSDVPPDGEEEDCFCPPSCSESEYQYISKPLINYESPNKDWAIVKIKLAYLPSERFTRRVICGKLDFAVCVGGVGGLLLGASLLSLIEIVHFLFLRPLMNLCQKLGSHH